MPRAASTTAGSTPDMPTMVLRTIGSSAYSTSAVTVGATPRPSTGISNPSSAKDGMVRIALVSAVAMVEPSRLRYTATPSSTPSAVAISVHCTTTLACSEESSSSDSQRVVTNSQKFTACRSPGCHRRCRCPR